MPIQLGIDYLSMLIAKHQVRHKLENENEDLSKFNRRTSIRQKELNSGFNPCSDLHPLYVKVYPPSTIISAPVI